LSINIEDKSLLDEMGPEEIVIFRDPSVDMKAILAIDNTAIGWTGGGIRMASDVSVDEIVRLARAMTYKFASYRLKVGGAKVGIIADPLSSSKNLIISSFATAIKPYILENRYIPGPDMGTYDSDIERIFNIIGKPSLTPKPLGLMKNGFPVEELYTGYGVVYCLESILTYLKTKQNLGNDYKPKIILEGFGKVGTSVAMSLNELGYKLTGISTIKGAVFDEAGLNIPEILNLQRTYGDDLIDKYQSENLVRIESNKLFILSSEYPTDFIIPGARQDVINKENVDKIDVKAIIPAANIPYEKNIINILEEKEIIAFPDYVANAGEILAIGVNKVAKDAEEIFNHVKSEIENKTGEIIKGAQANNSSFYNYAAADAFKYIKKYLSRRTKRIKKLNEKY
jgi:glutamate dehydrogenase (NAD(P)+)